MQVENLIEPIITEQLDNQRDVKGNQVLDEYQLFRQHDGAPSHHSVNM